MKFVCERCQTKYSITDEKVRQKVLKIRCKTCENVITIRDAVVVAEPAAPRIESPPAPVSGGGRASRAPEPRTLEWHLAVNGKQTGPFGLAALVTRILGAGGNDEVYIWNEHLDGWKEPKAVPEVAAEMRNRDAADHAVPPARRVPTPHGTARPSGATQPAPLFPPSARGARPSSAAMASVDHFAATGLEEEKTQISAMDASVLLSDPHTAPTRQQPQPAYLPAAQSAAHAAVTSHSAATMSGHAGGALRAPSAAHASVAAHAHAPAIAPLAPKPAPAVTARKVTQEMPPSAATPGVVPLPSSNGQVARKSGSMPATGLEGLDFSPPRAPSRAGISAVDLPLTAPAAPAAAAARPAAVNGGGGGTVAAPVVGGTTSMMLSQVGGRVARPRHPAIKFGIMGGVVAVLGGVIAVSMIGRGTPKVEKTAPAAQAAAPVADPEAQARAEAEKYFKSMVGTTAPAQASAPSTKSVGPAAKRPSTPAKKSPEAIAPVALAPPPINGSPLANDGSRATQRFTQDERKVAAPLKSGASKPAQEFDYQKFSGVIKQADHFSAIKSCYERALKRDANLKLARLDINVTVGDTGSAKKVRVAAPAEFASVSTCIQDAVRRWRFPATNREYEAVFPLILQGMTD